MMIKPVRIQRKRTKGFDMQAVSKAVNGLPALSVTRPGKYGNPFPVSRYGKLALYMFENNLRMVIRLRPDYLTALRGKNLACFCPLTSECHADILLRYANDFPA